MNINQKIVKNNIQKQFYFFKQIWFINISSIQKKIRHSENKNFSFIYPQLIKKYKKKYFFNRTQKIKKIRRIKSKIKKDQKELHENDNIFLKKNKIFFNHFNKYFSIKKNQFFYISFYILSINWFLYNIFFTKNIFFKSITFENWIIRHINKYSYFFLWKQNNLNQQKFFKIFYNFNYAWIEQFSFDKKIAAANSLKDVFTVLLNKSHLLQEVLEL